MGQQVDFELVGSYNNQRYPSINAERTINLFEYVDADSKKPKVLLPTSGLEDKEVFFPGIAGPIRAQFVFKDFMYFVAGTEVYRLDNLFIVTHINPVPLTTTVSYVGIDANTFQIIFVDGAHGYIYDTETLLFEQITDTSFPANPIDVTYLDGFFVVAHGGTNQFQLSEFNQGLIWGTVATSINIPFTATATQDYITIASGLSNFKPGNPVTFIGVPPPPELTQTNIYYLVETRTAPIANTIQVSKTKDGVPLTFTATTTGTPTISNISDIGSVNFFIVGPPTTEFTIAGGIANFQIGVPVTLDAMTAADLPTAVPPLVIGDTYYVVGHPVTPNTIQISATKNGTPITVTDVGTQPLSITNGGEIQLGEITSHPGTIVACRTLHRKLFLFSQNFTEVWENQGSGANLPFRRLNNNLIESGTPSIGSVAVGFDLMYFLSQDSNGLGPVMQVSGVNAVPVSNRALDFQLATYASNPLEGVADARGIVIKENGILFYRLNFTAANHTYVYNISMSNPGSGDVKWHEEDIVNGDRHPAQTHAYFFGNNYYGDYRLPIIYLVSSSLYTNAGQPIRRTRISKPIGPPGYQRTRIDRFQIDVIQGNIAAINDDTSGVNLLTEDNFILDFEDNTEILLEQGPLVGGSTRPVVYLSYSKDGGQTYGNVLAANMGEVGQLSFRTVWRKLGVVPRGQYFVTKIEFFNDYPFVILGAAWVVETLPE